MMGSSRPWFMTLVFRLDGSPVYSRGEKFCSSCRIVHPPEYPGQTCFFCHKTLRTRPLDRKNKKRGKRYECEESESEVPEGVVVAPGR